MEEESLKLNSDRQTDRPTSRSSINSGERRASNAHKNGLRGEQDQLLNQGDNTITPDQLTQSPQLNISNEKLNKTNSEEDIGLGDQNNAVVPSESQIYKNQVSESIINRPVEETTLSLSSASVNREDVNARGLKDNQEQGPTSPRDVSPRGEQNSHNLEVLNRDPDKVEVVNNTNVEDLPNSQNEHSENNGTSAVSELEISNQDTNNGYNKTGAVKSPESNKTANELSNDNSLSDGYNKTENVTKEIHQEHIDNNTADFNAHKVEEDKVQCTDEKKNSHLTLDNIGSPVESNSESATTNENDNLISASEKETLRPGIKSSGGDLLDTEKDNQQSASEKPAEEIQNERLDKDLTPTDTCIRTQFEKVEKRNDQQQNQCEQQKGTTVNSDSTDEPHTFHEDTKSDSTSNDNNQKKEPKSDDSKEETEPITSEHLSGEEVDTNLTKVVISDDGVPCVSEADLRKACEAELNKKTNSLTEVTLDGDVTTAENETVKTDSSAKEQDITVQKTDIVIEGTPETVVNQKKKSVDETKVNIDTDVCDSAKEEEIEEDINESSISTNKANLQPHTETQSDSEKVDEEIKEEIENNNESNDIEKSPEKQNTDTVGQSQNSEEEIDEDIQDSNTSENTNEGLVDQHVDQINNQQKEDEKKAQVEKSNDSENIDDSNKQVNSTTESDEQKREPSSEDRPDKANILSNMADTGENKGKLGTDTNDLNPSDNTAVNQKEEPATAVNEKEEPNGNESEIPRQENENDEDRNEQIQDNNKTQEDKPQEDGQTKETERVPDLDILERTNEEEENKTKERRENEDSVKEQSKKEPTEEKPKEPVIQQLSPLEQLLQKNVEIDGSLDTVDEVENKITKLICSMKDVMKHYTAILKIQALKDFTQDLGKFRGDVKSVNEAFKRCSLMSVNVNKRLRELGHEMDEVKSQLARKFQQEDLSTWIDKTEEHEKGRPTLLLLLLNVETAYRRYFNNVGIV